MRETRALPDAIKVELRGIGVPEHLVNQIEYAIGYADVDIQPNPASARAAALELERYERALQDVLEGYNNLSFRAHRALATASGRMLGNLPPAFGEAIAESRNAQEAREEMDRQAANERKPRGTPHDHILILCAQIADAAGFAENRTGLGRLIEVVFKAIERPRSNCIRDAGTAIKLWRAQGSPNPYRSLPSGATCQLVVTEPFGGHRRGDVISNAEAMAAALRDFPSCVVRTALK